MKPYNYLKALCVLAGLMLALTWGIVAISRVVIALAPHKTPAHVNAPISYAPVGEYRWMPGCGEEGE